MLCPDCVEAKEYFEKINYKYDFVNITESMANLKEFLHLRDTRKEFDDHYKSIYIGERYGLDKSTNVSRGYAVKRTLYRLDGDNEALSDEDVNNLQKKWDNYKTLFINPKDKDKWKKVL